MKVEAILNEVLGGNSSLTASQLRTSCPHCAKSQTLDQCTLSESDHHTLYTCTSGCGPLLIVSPPEGAAWNGRGYRMGNHVIRNACDLFVEVGSGVVLNGSPNALKNE